MNAGYLVYYAAQGGSMIFHSFHEYYEEAREAIGAAQKQGQLYGRTMYIIEGEQVEPPR